MAAITGLFSVFGLHAKSKILILDVPAPQAEASDDRSRSLNSPEHVSPAGLMRREISRRTPSGRRPDSDATLALMRRWFFARKPDAGFVLTDFPATLLQAKVFDEWLEARGEALDGVVARGPGHPALDHYRALGLVEIAGAGANSTAGNSPDSCQ
jgi:adenylate kinase